MEYTCILGNYIIENKFNNIITDIEEKDGKFIAKLIIRNAHIYKIGQPQETKYLAYENLSNTIVNKYVFQKN